MSFSIEQLDIEPVVLELAQKTVEEVRLRHGDLPYHNERHTLEVIEDSCAVAALHLPDLTRRRRGNLVLAAAYHDIDRKSEEQSAEIAVANMEKTGVFKPQDYFEVRGLVLATRWSRLGGKFLQDAETELEKCLADGNLATLGKPTPVYWERAQDLDREASPGNPLSTSDLSRFAESQIVFLRVHNFLTDAARKLFPHKAANIAYLEAVILTYTAT